MAQILVDSFVFEFVSQYGHASAGFILVSESRQRAGYIGATVATAFGIGAAALKEFWWDFKEENAATRGSSLLDFSMYCAGMGLGWFL